MAEERLQRCHLALGGLNTTQNNPLSSHVNDYLKIDSVFKTQDSITKHNITILKHIDIFLKDSDMSRVLMFMKIHEKTLKNCCVISQKKSVHRDCRFFMI